MPETTTIIQESAPIMPNTKEIPLEMGKHVTNYDFLKDVFKQGLCGYMLVPIEQKKDNPLSPDGIEITIIKEWKINKKTRICNEDCAEYLLNSIVGMINPVTLTGWLNEEKLYNNWTAIWYKVIFALEDNYKYEGNTYEILSMARIPDIATFTISFNSMSTGAIDGFKMKKMSDSEVTQRLIKSGYELSPQSGGGGIRQAIGNIFNGKKKTDNGN